MFFRCLSSNYMYVLSRGSIYFFDIKIRHSAEKRKGRRHLNIESNAALIKKEKEKATAIVFLLRSESPRVVQLCDAMGFCCSATFHLFVFCLFLGTISCATRGITVKGLNFSDWEKFRFVNLIISATIYALFCLSLVS